MSVDLALYAPDTLASKVEYCRLLADSGLLPDVYRAKPANVLYAVEYGESLGIPAMAAINGIHIIKGKPSASAGLVGALVRKAGHRLRVRGTDTAARAVIVRADDPDFEFVSEWTLERAVTAGLCTLRDGKPYARDKNGDPTSWEKYPAAMLKHRAVTEVARDACEEVLFGLHYTPEELGADVDEDGVPVMVAVSQDTAPQQQAEQVDEVEIVPEQEPRMVSDGQLKAVHALLAAKFGKKSDEERHAGFSKFTGREIASASELTFVEASNLIDAMSKMPDLEAEQPEQPAPAPRREAGDDNANFKAAEALLKLEEQQQGREAEELEQELRDSIESAGSPNELAAAMSDVVGLRDARRISGEQFTRLAAAADERAARARRELAGAAA